MFNILFRVFKVPGQQALLARKVVYAITGREAPRVQVCVTRQSAAQDFMAPLDPFGRRRRTSLKKNQSQTKTLCWIKKLIRNWLINVSFKAMWLCKRAQCLSPRPEERSLHELRATGRRKNAAKAGVALENPETLCLEDVERRTSTEVHLHLGALKRRSYERCEWI